MCILARKFGGRTGGVWWVVSRREKKEVRENGITCIYMAFGTSTRKESMRRGQRAARRMGGSASTILFTFAIATATAGMACVKQDCGAAPHMDEGVSRGDWMLK